MSNIKFKPLPVILFVFIFTTAIFSQETAKDKKEKEAQNKTSNLQIAPTNAGTQSNDVTEGVVILRVTFLASGKVGEVTLVSGLTDELNQQAIEAARKIKFEPAKKNGVAVTVTKTVEYSFSLYSEEDDADLQKKAEITKMPAPDYPKGKSFKGMSGKVELKLKLFPNGNIEIVQVKSELPQEFRNKAREAVKKIRFKPAIDKNGREVTQIKKIEYEFKPKND